MMTSGNLAGFSQLPSLSASAGASPYESLQVHFYLNFPDVSFFFFCSVGNFFFFSFGGAISYLLKMHRPWRKFNHLSWQRNERVQDALWSVWQLLSTLMPLPDLHLCWHLSWSVAFVHDGLWKQRKNLHASKCRHAVVAFSDLLFSLLLLAASFILSSRSLTPCIAFLLPTRILFPPLFLSAPEPVKFKFSPRFFWRDEFLCCILRMPSVFAGSSSF